MFDEPGYSQNPISNIPKPTPKPIIGLPAPNPPPLTIPRRPLWLRLAAYFVGFLVISRICGSSLQAPVSIMVQFASAVMLILILIGLLDMRRWAAYMFILYCGWTVLSSMVLVAVRLSLLDEVILNPFARNQIMFSELFYMALGFMFYSALGLWFGFNLRIFRSAGPNRYGALPYVVLIGVLLLFSAAQISEARYYLELQADALRESEGLIRQLNNSLNNFTDSLRGR